MKKSLFITLIFLMAILLLSGCGKKEPYVYEGVELLENCHMEDGDGEMEDPLPANWIKGGQKGKGDSNDGIPADDTQLNDISWETIDDNKCIKINTKTDKDNFIYAGQYITNIPIGKKLKLTVRIKTDKLDGEGVSIAFLCDSGTKDGPNQFVSTENRVSIKDTKDWTTYSIELGERVRPGVKYITVFLTFLPNSSGTVYFDDASLVY